MEFNFADAYRDYSNNELLKIILQPGDYQPEAVLAAAEILKTRQVSEEEKQDVENHYAGIHKKLRAKQEKIDGYKEKAADIFEPVLHPGTSVKAEKWFRLFLIFLSLEYCREWFYLGRLVFFDLKSRIVFDEPLIPLLNFGQILYGLSLLYLLYKRKKAGLVILLSTNAFFFVISEGRIFYMYKPFFSWRSDVIFFLYHLFLNGAIIAFLCRKDIGILFRLPVSQRNTIVLISASAGFLLAAYAIFHYA